MESVDRIFWTALAYTVATSDKDIDQATFFQKLEENRETFSKLKPKKTKIRTIDRTKLGLR